MNIDASIKRISNGYIIKNKDNPEAEVFYQSLREYCEAVVSEGFKDKDKYFREHDADGEIFTVTLVIK